MSEDIIYKACIIHPSADDNYNDSCNVWTNHGNQRQQTQQW